MKIYKMNQSQKNKLSKKVLKYAREEFSHQKTVDMWHNTMINTLKDFKEKRKNWNITEY